MPGLPRGAGPPVRRAPGGVAGGRLHTYAKGDFAELYDRKTPLTAADLPTTGCCRSTRHARFAQPGAHGSRDRVLRRAGPPRVRAIPRGEDRPHAHEGAEPADKRDPRAVSQDDVERVLPRGVSHAPAASNGTPRRADPRPGRIILGFHAPPHQQPPDLVADPVEYRRHRIIAARGRRIPSGARPPCSKLSVVQPM